MKKIVALVLMIALSTMTALTAFAVEEVVDDGLVEVTAFGEGSIRINPEYREDMVVFIDDTIYTIDENFDLIETDETVVIPYSTYTESFSLANNKSGQVNKNATKGTTVLASNICASGDLRRFQCVGKDLENYGYMERTEYSFGFGFVAPLSQSYYYTVTNLSAGTISVTIELTY